MYRPKNTQSAILHRMQIARGHLDKVITMVKQDAYCIDVIHQSLAIQAALKKTDQVLLKHHLQTCVADSLKRGDDKEVISELIKVLDKK